MKSVFIALLFSVMICTSSMAADYDVRTLSGYDVEIPADWSESDSGDTSWFYPSYAYRYPDGKLIGLFQLYTSGTTVDTGYEDAAIERFEYNIIGNTNSCQKEAYSFHDSYAKHAEFTLTIDRVDYEGEYIAFIQDSTLSAIIYIVSDDSAASQFESDFYRIIDGAKEHAEDNNNVLSQGLQDNVSTDLEGSEKVELTKYGSGQYIVGKDIPAGKYVIFASESGRGGYMFESHDANLDDILQSARFDYETIAEVTEGNYLKLDHAYAIPLDENPNIDTSKPGAFLVGKHIAAGEYKIEQIDSERGAYYFLYTDFSKDNFAGSDSFEGSRYVSVTDGQLLELSNAHIVTE